MTVIHIFWSLSFGGIETMLINIANAQVEQNANVHVMIINDLYDDELLRKFDRRIVVHLIHRKCGSKSLSFAFRMNKLLANVAPDAIHIHMSKFYKLIWPGRLRRITCVTLHALPRGSVKPDRILYRLFPILGLYDSGNVIFIDKVPAVFAISDAVKDELWQKYNINSIVVNNGILTQVFRHRLNMPIGEVMNVVMVSRLEHNKKGQDLLIRAVAILQGKIHVTFIGEGKSRFFLENLTRELNVEKYIHFLGVQSQSYIAEHLCDYDLFVQPSRREGFGLTVAEAMASKLPVLVSAGQGPAEVTCGNCYGWVFENGSVDDLAKQLNYIYSHYDDALSKANRALQYVCRTYDVSVTAKKYLKLYQQMNESRGNIDRLF